MLSLLNLFVAKRLESFEYRNSACPFDESSISSRSIRAAHGASQHSA
jgi:hypothetical protein